MSTLTSLDGGTSSNDTRSVLTTNTVSLPSSSNSQRGKEGFVRRLFDAISPGYDFFNRVASFGLDQKWRRQTIARLHLVPEMRVLDLASGTGDLARLAAEEIAPLGCVVGCDLSGEMLKLAQKKFAKIPSARWHIKLTQGRAENLPFQDQSFDAATMGFALRNVSSLDETFREFHRVLKPDGRLSLLEFSRPNGFLVRLGHRFWLTVAVPLIGIITTRKVWPFLYLRHSILQFMPTAEVVKRLESAGFTNVQAESLTFGSVTIYSARRP